MKDHKQSLDSTGIVTAFDISDNCISSLHLKQISEETFPNIGLNSNLSDHQDSERKNINVDQSIVQKKCIVKLVPTCSQYKCDHCDFQTECVSALKRHIVVHLDEFPFTCNICCKGFRRKHQLQRHERNLHGKFPEGFITCLPPYLRNDREFYSDERPFQCGICFKDFKNKSNLRKHMVVHSNARPFKCSFCPQAFKRKFGLKSHMVVHSQQRLFKCIICFKAFKRKRNLHAHMVSHSEHRPYKCTICSKTFKRKGNLQVHLQVHSSDRRYKCQICFKDFKTNSSLKRHIAIHSKQPFFNCEICCKSFKRKCDLESHMMSYMK